MMTNEENLVLYNPGNPRPERMEVRPMTDAEIMAAARSDPDTVIVDDHFMNTHAMVFSPDGRRRFIVVPENSMLEVDAENHLLGFMPRLPFAPPGR